MDPMFEEVVLDGPALIPGDPGAAESLRLIKSLRARLVWKKYARACRVNGEEARACAFYALACTEYPVRKLPTSAEEVRAFEKMTLGEFIRLLDDSGHPWRILGRRGTAVRERSSQARALPLLEFVVEGRRVVPGRRE